MTTVASYCRFCSASCGILVDVLGTDIQSVRGDPSHPLSQGYVCGKGRSLGAWHHHPQRLDHPYARNTAEGWTSVLDDLAGSLRSTIDGSGPDAVGFFFGTGSAFDSLGRRAGERLGRAIGTNARYTSATVDTPCKPLVSELMSGDAGLTPVIDRERVSMTVLIGTNPVVSHGHLNAFTNPIQSLRSLAAAPRELWVLDPRRTETAQLATVHLATRPGSDYALLAAAVRALLLDGADEAYLREHTDDGDLATLRSSTSAWTPARSAMVTGLAEVDVLRFIDRVRHHGRVAVQTGTGTTMSRTANVTEWLAWALQLVTGSFDRPGGSWFNPGFIRCLDQREIDRPAKTAVHPSPRSRPELSSVTGEYPCAAMADEIEAGNLRALIVVGGNPLTALPEPGRLAAALSSLDVLAVADVVESSTTRIASHVLACTGQLERSDVPHFVEQYFPAIATNYTPAVVPPGAGRRPLWWIMAQIGDRLGLHVLPPGVDTPDDVAHAAVVEDDLMRLLVDRGRSTFASLREDRFQVEELDLDRHFGWVERSVLRDGRWNLAPLPLVEQLASIGADEPTAQQLVLIPRRQPRRLNSQVPKPHDGNLAPSAPVDRPEALLNPADAANAEVADGDEIRIGSPHGAIVASVKVDQSIVPGAVSLPHGYEHPNATALTSAVVDIDPLSGMVRQSGVPVTISRV